MSATPKGIYASLPRVVRGKVTLLKGDPKGKNFLYTNGNSVFIRDIENPAIVDVYTQHPKEVTVAAYAPSGFYICSGDVTGKVRIWDTTSAEHLLKYEYTCIGGIIKDIAWSPDSKRIVVVGEGRETFAKVFLWDSGSTVGNCNGHSAMINAVDYKPTRPFRICTASEDRTCGFFEGPPFKFKHLNREFGNYVNCVSYSPNGEFFVAGSADGKLCLYDGKEGSFVEELVDEGKGKGTAHIGGIYGVSWSPDSSSVLSASADKTCKIWNIADKSLATTFEFGSQLEDMQLGCLWQGDHLLSVSLSGNINYLDRNNTSTPSRIVKGHFKNIMAVAACKDRKKIYTASFDSRLASWTDDGQASYFTGAGHKNQISQMQVVGDELVTCSMDNTLRFTPLETEEYGSDVIGFDAQPQGFGAGNDGLIIVALEKQIAIIRNKKVVHIMKVHYDATGASLHIGQTEVAVGGKDGNVYIYTLDNDTLEEKTKIELTGQVEVVTVAYSPDGGFLAVGTSQKRIHAYQKIDYKEISKYWTSHTAKITSLAWSPDSRHVASSSLDTNVCVYSPDKPSGKIIIKAAHPQSVVSCVTWYENNTLVSVGYDCCVRLWNITPL